MVGEAIVSRQTRFRQATLVEALHERGLALRLAHHVQNAPEVRRVGAEELVHRCLDENGGSSGGGFSDSHATARGSVAWQVVDVARGVVDCLLEDRF